MSGSALAAQRMVGVCGRSALLCHGLLSLCPASYAASVLGRRSGGVAGLLPRPSVRFASTAMRNTLPQPIVFKPITLDSQSWFEAQFLYSRSGSVPVFLTAAQHAELERFIHEAPSAKPQLLMPLGTVKSGTSRLLQHILPGMIASAVAARWPKSRGRPVLFHYDFPPYSDAEELAGHLHDNLQSFGRGIGVPFAREGTPSSVLRNLPTNICTFAERVHADGGELWLLMDELHAPGMGYGSSPAKMQDFIRMFTQIVEQVSPIGRIVATGSGLLALLSAFLTTRVNGSSLWDAASFLSVGREPSIVAAQSIAAALHVAYATVNDWPHAAKFAITPTSLMGHLATTAHDQRTSPRPALLAYVLDMVGDARGGGGDEVIAVAIGAVMDKVHFLPRRDTLAAVIALDSKQRRVLRDVATGGYTVAELETIRTGRGKVHFKGANVGALPEKLAALITCLSEEGAGSDVVRLQPPYANLLKSWLSNNGEMEVSAMRSNAQGCVVKWATSSTSLDSLDLDAETRRNLDFVAQPSQCSAVSAALREKASTAIMAALARNNVGTREADGSVRPPRTAAEFIAIPALQGLQDMVMTGFLAGNTTVQPSLCKALRRAAAAEAVEARPTSRFKKTIGWHFLQALSYFSTYTFWRSPAALVRNGLTAIVVAEVVRAGCCVLADPAHGCFHITRQHGLVLVCVFHKSDKTRLVPPISQSVATATYPLRARPFSRGLQVLLPPSAWPLPRGSPPGPGLSNPPLTFDLLPPPAWVSGPKLQAPLHW